MSTKQVHIKSESVKGTYKLGVIKEFSKFGRYDDIEIKQVENIVVISSISKLN